jgi:hypothetical protein
VTSWRRYCSKVTARGGVAVIPVFAVGRAQALLHAIALLKLRKEISALGAGISGQPDGRAHDPPVRAAPWCEHRLTAQAVTRPHPQRNNGQQHRRVQGAGSGAAARC